MNYIVYSYSFINYICCTCGLDISTNQLRVLLIVKHVRGAKGSRGAQHRPPMGQMCHGHPRDPQTEDQSGSVSPKNDRTQRVGREWIVGEICKSRVGMFLSFRIFFDAVKTPEGHNTFLIQAIHEDDLPAYWRHQSFYTFYTNNDTHLFNFLRGKSSTNKWGFWLLCVPLVVPRCSCLSGQFQSWSLLAFSTMLMVSNRGTHPQIIHL